MMPTPNMKYRENPERAVYITGEINQDLVNRVTPAINVLRHGNTNPITVYIDSPGGSTVLADTIRHHLKAANADGERCRIITVVISRASSAAADFFALGDYAIIYPNADLLYHGTRTAANMTLTTEAALGLSRSLYQLNEYYAVNLSRHAFSRFILRLTQFKDEFPKYVDTSNLVHLTVPLTQKLSPSNAKLVREAKKKQEVIEKLNVSVLRRLS
ncbi:MAG: ATP-dependent Clp protease proteolytic subunit [Phycisphaerae bacterium]